MNNMILLSVYNGIECLAEYTTAMKHIIIIIIIIIIN